MAILLFTDFGASGPYLGQVQAVLHDLAPNVSVIDVVNNAPSTNPIASSYLLAALTASFNTGSVFLAVVDPGVGGARKGLVIRADGKYFIAPDNGLLNVIAAQAKQLQCWQIVWQPQDCSKTFHGRDLFAPIAARLATGTISDELQELAIDTIPTVALDLSEIIYFDCYGNAMTGVQYKEEHNGKVLKVNEYEIQQAEIFTDVNKGCAFWYQNSVGLIEIAVNRGNAKQILNLAMGDCVVFLMDAR